MQVLAQSRTVQQVPYAHVGYLAAASVQRTSAEETAGLLISLGLLALVALSLVGVVVSGAAGIVRARKGVSTGRRWLVAILLFAVLLTLSGAALLVHEYQEALLHGGRLHPRYLDAVEEGLVPAEPEASVPEPPQDLPPSGGDEPAPGN